jgi:membrane protein YdbS with pleckstrin-like domain
MASETQRDESQPVSSTPHSILFEETDVWWGAYSVRTLIPHCIACVLLSAVVLAVAWFEGAWHGSTLLHHLTIGLVAGTWTLLVAYGLYRASAFSYRLTTRRLFINRSFRFHSPAAIGIPLRRIVRVTVERDPFERLSGVGRIRIQLPAGEAQPALLEGVRSPKQAAVRIRKMAANALNEEIKGREG